MILVKAHLQGGGIIVKELGRQYSKSGEQQRTHPPKTTTTIPNTVDLGQNLNSCYLCTEKIESSSHLIGQKLIMEYLDQYAIWNQQLREKGRVRYLIQKRYRHSEEIQGYANMHIEFII